MVFVQVFGAGATPYAFIYVYASIALENLCFAVAYKRLGKKLFRLPFHYGYKNFDRFASASLVIAALMYAPILFEFPQYILNPRQIYEHTRTGFGLNFFVSSTFAYLAVILILFSERSKWIKGFVFLAAAVILLLHGSKGQVLTLLVVLLLYEVYVRGRKFKFMGSMLAISALGFAVLLMFFATMTLGEDAGEVLESISQYSDYTRNAMLVIDSNYPIQYGRLTLEDTILGRIPRAVMPDKPKNFGAFQLADHFYPEAMDRDQGAPDFGMGVQYADFGVFAIGYLAIFAIIRGWLARACAARLRRLHHPADFVLFAFVANVSIFPVGGVGWLLPEAIAVAVFLRFASGIGAEKVFREKIVYEPRVAVAAP